MSRIQTLLAQIKSAIYGREVRNSIHDAIEECYEDVSAAKTLADGAVASANTAIVNVNTAKDNANAAASSANTATTNTNTAIQNANTAATNATSAKTQCEAVVAALPTQITGMFAELGIALVDGKLCVEVIRE